VPPVSDAQYAADLRSLIPHSIGLPMPQAQRAIEDRENKLIAAASSLKVVGDNHEPEPLRPRDFRIPLRKPPQSTKRRTPRSRKKSRGSKN
jgi:hypothetical protein